MTADALADLFSGAARVLAPGDDLARFELPARGAPGKAALVVQPATDDEVREVVRHAYVAGVRLLPQGANTGLVGASVPPADDPCVVLSLDRLSGDPEIDPVGATAVVAAGTRLSALNAAAIEHGLQLPVDLAADPAIGGMIATNTGGNRMVRYGPMRRYVLGVELVAADELATVYGRLAGVRKDSRGLDPVHMAVGSGGTLGVITRAVVGLVRVPRTVETWWLAVEDPAVTVDLQARLDERRPGSISAFEFIARTAMERTLAAPGAPPNPFGSVVPAASVLVEWSFPGDATGDLADDVDAMFSQGLVTDGRLVDGAAAWTLRHGVSDALRTFGVVLGHDISAPLGSLMAMRDEAIAIIADVAPDVVVCDFGHAGDGGLHLNVLVPTELGPPSAELAGRIRAAVDDVVARYGGSYSAEHGLGPLNAERWLADTPPIEQRMIAALKDVVDPRRILGHPRHPYNLLRRWTADHTIKAVSPRPNVLFITLDQFRGDSLSCAGHPVVRTPHLDALAAEGVRLARHYAQAAPCAPGRAALYTGTYQMNNRVVANGTPLDDRLDNVARAARRVGYRPAMFGYTDQGVDPRRVSDPADPRLSEWEGVLPGFDCVLELIDDHRLWLEWLRHLGYDEHVDTADAALRTESTRPEEHSVSTFLTDALLSWIDQQDEPWFAHASYLRPHPPYNAAGRFATLYDPSDCPTPLPVPASPHPLHTMLLGVAEVAAPHDPHAMAELQAQYFGMISEVDAQLGRVWAHLRDTDVWDNTLVVVTADHGEQLGDQGLVQKAGFYESSYHIVGIIRDPTAPHAHGTVVERFTENVDVMPTICEAIGSDVPLQCDGLPLTPLLRGEDPPLWRDAAHYEWDWRDVFIGAGGHAWPWDRRLERHHLAVRRSADRAYVQFGDGSWRCFDLATDPTWQTEVADPAVVLADAQEMLVWRSRHADRTLTDVLLRDGGVGRFARYPGDGLTA